MSNPVPPAPHAAETEHGQAVDIDHEHAGEDFGRAFKGTMAAVRRLRGRETHQPGELSDAQYSALFCLRANETLSTGEIAVEAGVSPASATEMLDGLARAGL